MAQYYTPFMTQAGAAIGSGLKERGLKQQQDEQNKLAYSAYMGDPQAMQNLSQLNPEMAIKVQESARKRKATTEQQGLQKQTAFKKEYDDVMENIAKFSSFEEAQSYADTRIADIGGRYPEIMAKIGADSAFDEEDFQLAKSLAGGDDAFVGKGMEAQDSNILSKGVDDPAFRDSPEYALSWKRMNEPKIIRTPTGDIIMRPEIPNIFKPPGPAKTEEQEVAAIKKTAKEDVERVAGTEKKLKTSADEKLSLGFYSRMTEDEANIAKLGNFDSADIWERMKGVTNISASPELQQYRQAADDWIRAKLRRESGAVIAPEEMAKEYEIYFPQVGDSQAVIDQKKASRATAQEAMKTASGLAYKEPEDQTVGRFTIKVKK